MANAESIFQFPPHDHVFLGEDHDRAERRTWAVIILFSIMMTAEIIGGALFGSLALIADGLHMSTHAGGCCWPRWLIPMPGNTRTIAASRSAPASSAIWRDTPVPSFWR